MKNIIALVGVVTILFVQSGLGQSNEALNAIFEKHFDRSSNTPGLAVAVIQNKEVLYKNTFGFANLEYDIPISTESVFDIASLAKQFTGYAIAKLIVAEELSLEASVVKLIPELINLPTSIRVKHLIHHTSGIRDIGELFSVGQYGETFTSVEAINILKKQKGLNFEVGTESDYSNSNYVLLAVIVERLSEKSFRNWCQEHIFDPLDMKRSFANDNALELVKNRAVAYYTDGDNFSFLQNNGMSLIGASSVYTTIDDMAKWAIALQKGYSNDPVVQQLISDGFTNDKTPVGYGYGFGLGTYNGIQQVEHTGATPAGFRSVISWFPEEELTVVMLSNWGNINLIGDFGKKIIDVIMADEKKEFPEVASASPTNPPKTQEAADIDMTSEMIDKIVGEYLFNNEMAVKISHSDAALVITPEGQSPLPLIPLGNDRFDFPAFKSVLEFETDDANLYNSATIYAGPQLERHGTLLRISNEDMGTLMVDRYVGNYYSEELGVLLNIDSHDGQLQLNNEKHGELKLNMKSLLVFRPDGHFASSIEFQKTDDGVIDGLLLNRGSRLRNMVFNRISLE